MPKKKTTRNFRKMIHISTIPARPIWKRQYKNLIKQALKLQKERNEFWATIHRSLRKYKNSLMRYNDESHSIEIFSA